MEPTVRLILCLLLFPLFVTASPLLRHDVRVDGHNLALWQKSAENSASKATILLLHGRTWSALPDFDLQVKGEEKSFMDGLNQKGFNVYALDQKGYGETKRDNTGWLTPDRAVKDTIAVLAWIRAHEKGPVYLFGWSYGSLVSQLVAQRSPEAADAVILFGYPYDPARFKYSPDDQYPATPPAEANTAANAASDFIVPGSISKLAIDTYVTEALKVDPIRVDFKDLHQWDELDASMVTVPTLLLQAESDPLALTPVHQSFFATIETTQKWWISLKGGDHAALLESPREEMLGAMDGFLTLLVD